jgi:hypothetical protein
MARFVFVFNTLADTISNYAMDIGGKTWWQLKRLKLGDHFVLSSEGARREMACVHLLRRLPCTGKECLLRLLLLLVL